MGLYSLALSIESPLPPGVVLDRIREMVATRQMIDTPRFRWRQILGWAFQERANGYSLQPVYAGSVTSNGARFEFEIEPAGAASRIVGQVVVAWLTRAIMSIWLIVVAIAPFLLFIEQTSASPTRAPSEPLKFVFVAAGMIAVGVLLVRYSLRSTATLVEDGVRAAVAAA
jgi:hypothetical protein